MTNHQSLWRLCLISLALLLGANGLAAPAVHSAVRAAAQPLAELRLSTVSDAVTGDRIQVIVSGINLVDAYAYELKFTYDPLRLRFVDARSEIAGFTLAPAVNGNRIKLAHTQTGHIKGVSGDLRLAVITFDAIAGGDASVTLHKAALVDSQLILTELQPEMGATVAIKGKQPSSYTDIGGHWAESSIKRATGLGIVTGYADGAFRPDTPVNRAEFATMLARAVDYPIISAEIMAFIDMAAIPQWARPSVNAVSNARLIVGFEDGSFRGERMLSRSEMAAIIVRAAGLSAEAGAPTSFADDNTIPQWAKAYVAAGWKVGILAGKGHNKFAPAAEMTRAEGVVILLNLIDYLESSK